MENTRPAPCVTAAGSAAFLRLLRDQPALMDPAPATVASAHIGYRIRDEIHACLRCGRRAQVVYVAATFAGPRWLDLCALCARWARLANETGTDPGGT
jgi:hypothetical protein